MPATISPSNVASILVNPAWVPASEDKLPSGRDQLANQLYDIALVKLGAPVTDIAPAKIWLGDPSGLVGTLTGYGFQDTGLNTGADAHAGSWATISRAPTAAWPRRTSSTPQARVRPSRPSSTAPTPARAGTPPAPLHRRTAAQARCLTDPFDRGERIGEGEEPGRGEMKAPLATCSLVTLLVAGCVADTVRGYVGQDIRAVMLAYGPPAGEIDLGGGTRAFQWSKTSVNTTPVSAVTTTSKDKKGRKTTETQYVGGTRTV